MPETVERKRLTNEIWEQMVERCNHACLRCGAKAYPMSQDHIAPIEKGGTNEADNIQPLCLECNQGKATANDDYRPADWPWLLKPLALEPQNSKPDDFFLETANAVQVFLSNNRSPQSVFMSAEDPHVTFDSIPGDRFEMRCTACFETGIFLTQKQIDKSVDNYVSEAHVAWHLAQWRMSQFENQEKRAAQLYQPA